MDNPDLESQVGNLEKVLSEFSQDLHFALRYVKPDPASSLTKSRLVLEKAVLKIYVTEMEREPRKPLLGEMLVDNQFTRKIERRILSRMNAIRDLGNLGPHGEPVEPSDAVRVLADLCEVLRWYLSRYAGGVLAKPEGRERLPGAPPGTQEAEPAQPRHPAGMSVPAGANPDNLLHLMWDCLDQNLQAAFARAYINKRLQGGNRISTKDFFGALAGLGDGSLQPLIDALPKGALPEPVAPDVPPDRRLVLEERPLLSDCVEESLEHFRELEDLPRRISPADMFVDIAKHGHGPSVVRLREHGVGEQEIEEQVRRLGLSVLRRKGG
jgi:hypothetical protein